MIDLDRLPKDGTAVLALSLSTDRAIPDAHMSAARALDAAWRRKNPDPQIAKIRIGAITLKRGTAIDMMALQIVRSAETGCVREVDLSNLGFTAKQIADLAPQAYRKALAEHPNLADLLAA